MSNYETNAFLEHGLPPGVKLSGLESALFLIICHRYDTTKAVPSAYPGMELFLRVTGKSRSTIECALKGLKDKKIITQIKRGYTSQRAEYVPTYAVALVNGVESVRYINTLESGVLAIPAQSVSNTDVESPVYAERVSSPPVTISNKSNINKNKYDSLRFNSVVLSAIPERLRTISPGSNFEKLLDECDSLGITDEIRRLLTTNRWHNVEANAGGIVSKIIKDAIERKRSGQLVASPVKATSYPERYVEETRELEPISDKTKELIEETKRKMINTFGAMPE
jgi:hypothetical protein